MEIFHTYIFLTPLIIMLLSEGTKHVFEGLSAGLWFHHGGMPSTHSAFVTSLLIVVGNKEGLESTMFGIATTFACIVWYDAIFVRSQVGQQAKVLNVMQQFQQFSERIGHSLMEVIAGICFGAAGTYIVLGW